ncbi:proteasome assembly chaperone family protein [Candidatus Nanohalococcus occultus]|uniref:Proteasome activator, proteasome assembly chaperone n=1 Tax=Candidatus Nanohalococcus occultus TaxID=2978047 RepID=A0ABY8CDM3_9ARCH|nr:Proteasome activator, proteasome assembly chaperone [Candidatus Nanohaloarchaeota archaeon SVXNc]
METTRIELEQELDVEKPIFIEGLAGIGHVGKTSVAYLADHLGAEKVGELYSHHFPPYTIVTDEKTVELLKNDIYQIKRDDKADIVLIEGNAQASTPEGHFEVAEKIIELVEETEPERIVTIGGYGTGEVVEDPSVFGVTSSDSIQEEYESADIEFEHDVDQIVGASGLILGIGKDRGYEGICLLGETPGFLLSDPKATEAVLNTLESMLELDLDYSELDEKVQESQDVLKKLQNIQNQQSQDQDQQNSDLGYIG